MYSYVVLLIISCPLLVLAVIQKLHCYSSGTNYSRMVRPGNWALINCYASGMSDPMCMFGFFLFDEGGENASFLIAGCGDFEKCVLQAPPITNMFQQYRPESKHVALRTTCCNHDLCNFVKSPAMPPQMDLYSSSAIRYLNEAFLSLILIYCIKKLS